jgi:hypothetical protein
MRTSLKKAVGVGILALSMVTIGSVASAAAPEPTVNACVGKLTGLVRIIDPKQSCTGLEKPLSWNQRGVPGPADQPGPAGPAGATGPQRPTGSDNVLWARVQTRDSGVHGGEVVTFASQRHATGVGFGGEFRHYRVAFDRPVDQCAAQVTPESHLDAEVGYFGLPANELEVALLVPGGDSAQIGDFAITVNC